MSTKTTALTASTSGPGSCSYDGIVALVGIENPRRRVRCADCPPTAVSTTEANLATERA